MLRPRAPPPPPNPPTGPLRPPHPTPPHPTPPHPTPSHPDSRRRGGSRSPRRDPRRARRRGRRHAARLTRRTREGAGHPYTHTHTHARVHTHASSSTTSSSQPTLNHTTHGHRAVCLVPLAHVHVPPCTLSAHCPRPICRLRDFTRKHLGGRRRARPRLSRMSYARSCKASGASSSLPPPPVPATASRATVRSTVHSHRELHKCIAQLRVDSPQPRP